MSDREIPATSWAAWAWQAYRDGRLVEADRIEELEANINIKADFIDATINQLAASDQRIEELEAKLDDKEAECRHLRGQVGLLQAKLAKAVEALGEAVYLLAPDEKDMMRQAGVYRVVTTLAELSSVSCANLKGQEDEWKCPINHPNCEENCGNYGCGN